MKLFKSLLIAPAAFGLMAPIEVNADTAFSPTATRASRSVSRMLLSSSTIKILDLDGFLDK